MNDAGHPSTTVIPLTTQLTDDAVPLRFRIAAREELQSDSDAMIDQIRAIDNRRFTSEPLIELTERELAEFEEYLRIVLGLSD